MSDELMNARRQALARELIGVMHPRAEVVVVSPAWLAIADHVLAREERLRTAWRAGGTIP